MVIQPRHNPLSEEDNSFKKNAKRLNNYWEPIFDPSFSGLNNEFNWSTNQSSKIIKSMCSSKVLHDSMKEEEPRAWKGRGLKFIECDFSGDFVPIMSFNNCSFFKCDMGSAIWRGVKFSNCEFDRCSFTVSTFEHCNFHDCTWESIGISGTETKLFDTIITNPESFINSAYTNTNKEELKSYGAKNPSYQTFRLEESKVKLARLVLSNNERNADDKAYYEPIKIYLKQSISAKISKAKYERSVNKNKLRNFISQWLGFIEGKLISFSGSINGWGGNVSRATICGVGIIVIFALIYACFSVDSKPVLGWKLSLIKSFDITLLVGYTKHATVAQTWQEQALYGANAVLGLWWYTIFVPTIINRICKVR